MVNEKLSVVYPFLFIESLLCFALAVLLHLDWIVHNVLYRYNLVFSLDWAVPYWTALRIIMALLIVAAASIAVLGFQAYRRARKDAERVVYLCKSCGNAWTELDKSVKIKEKLPRFKILKSCATCDKKILDE